MPVLRLEEFLHKHQTPFTTIIHSTTYTAQGTAAVAHVPGQELAKTVILNADGCLAMAVLPANKQLDLALFRSMMGAQSMALATEEEFDRAFPDCELGAMPPFGNLYNVPVYVEETLTHHSEIVFNAGYHSELIRMSFRDFCQLVHPVIAKFAMRPAAA
jgi:Ala-tRNA(Pro) deacylase